MTPNQYDITNYSVGQELKVWSNRVFGVPVHFTVEQVGRKLLHGTFRYGLGSWKGSLVPCEERVLGSWN